MNKVFDAYIEAYLLTALKECPECGHSAHNDPCSFVAGPGQRCRCVAKTEGWVTG